MTSRSEYRYQGKKPIRKDRVLIAMLFVAAIIVIPLLLVRFGCTRDTEPLSVVDDGLVVIADDPMTCVARGGGRVIELMDEHGPSVFGLE